MYALPSWNCRRKFPNNFRQDATTWKSPKFIDQTFCPFVYTFTFSVSCLIAFNFDGDLSISCILYCHGCLRASEMKLVTFAFVRITLFRDTLFSFRLFFFLIPTHNLNKAPLFLLQINKPDHK